MTRRRRAPAQGAARPRRRREHLSEAVVLSTCNRTEIYVVAEQFHGAYAGRPQLPLRDGVPAARGLRRPPLRPLRRRGRRPTCSRWPPGSTRRWSARPRSSVRSRDAWERAQDEGAAGPSLQPAVPPRGRGRQAGPHRDRHRPRHRPRCPGRGGHGRRAARRRSTAAASWCSAPARWARAWSRALAARRASTDVLHRQPHVGAGRRRWPSSVGGDGRSVSPSCPAAAGRGRPAAHLHRAPARCMLEHGDLEPRDARPGPAGRCSSSTSPCPATSTRRRRELDGVTLLDMDDLRGLRRGSLARSYRSAPDPSAVDHLTIPAAAGRLMARLTAMLR